MRGNVDQSYLSPAIRPSVGSIPSEHEARTGEWTAPVPGRWSKEEMERGRGRSKGGGEGDKERQARREERNNE